MSTAKAERYARQAKNCDTVEDVGDYMKRGWAQPFVTSTQE